MTVDHKLRSLSASIIEKDITQQTEIGGSYEPKFERIALAVAT